jgi:hypothetical protein
MRGRYVEIAATKQNRTLRVAAPVSKSGTYGLKYSEEFIADVTAKLHYSDGSEINQPAFKVFDVENAVIVLEVEDGPDPLRIVGVSGDAWRSPFVERVRASASTANSQFKAAIKSRAAPALLVIDDSQSMVSDIRQFQAAFYGDLAIRWNLTTNETDGLHHAGNRLWQQGKNTTTSAACYLRQDAPPVILHNIWADCPLPWGTLSAYELFPRSDGTWQEVDNLRQHRL